jgi:hypothetical protein
MTDKNTFKIPFTAVRGGDLTITLSVLVGTTPLTAVSKNLKIVGKDPSTHELSLVANGTTAFRKLMRVESGLRQFLAGKPYFSEDDLGGAGICQVTRPKPSDDEVWNWRANVAAGWLIYQGKESEARAHPKNYRKSNGFKDLVDTYNDERYRLAVQGAAAAKPPLAAKEVARKDLAITIPDFTSDQLERTTIRLYNGSPRIYEYMPRLDTKRTPDGSELLYVTVDEPNLKGMAEWEEVSAERRIQEYDKDPPLAQKLRGDPAYVDDVSGKASF